MPKWIRYTLGFLLLLALALVANRIINKIRGPEVTEQDDGITHVQPPRPLFPRGDRVEVADSTGRTETIRVDRGRDVEAVVRVDPPADSAEAEPALLLVSIEPARGFFPEFTGRRDRVRIRALSGGSRTVVTEQARPLVALEAVPLLGASLRARITGPPVVGVPVGLTIMRLGPLHVGAALDVRAAYRGRIEPSAWLTSSLYGPLDLGLGVALTPGVRPAAAVYVSF